MDLHLGDCLEILKTVETGSVDMVLADLPYGTTACKWDSIIPFEPLWEELYRICKPRAVMCMFGREPFSSFMRISNLKRFRYDWIWNKKRPSNPLLAKKQNLRVHEVISVFHNGVGIYNPQGVFETDGKPRGGVKPSKMETRFGPGPSSDYMQTRSGYPKSIIEFGSDNTKNVRPTQKPVALLEYLIKTYTNEGDTVLDPTMGSGSTGVACQNIKRKFVGIEKDPAYFEIARARLAEVGLCLSYR